MGHSLVYVEGFVLLILTIFPSFGESVKLSVGEKHKLTCTQDGKNKLYIYPFSNIESFAIYTTTNVISMTIKAQTFDNGSSMKCTTSINNTEIPHKHTDVFLVPSNAGVKGEFEGVVMHDHVFHENDEFDFSCNSTVVGWIKVDANNVVTDGRTARSFITKKFNLTSVQFDGAKLICLQFVCISAQCDRVVQKVVQFRAFSTNTARTTLRTTSSTTLKPTTTSTTPGTTLRTTSSTTLKPTTTSSTPRATLKTTPSTTLKPTTTSTTPRATPPSTTLNPTTTSATPRTTSVIRTTSKSLRTTNPPATTSTTLASTTNSSTTVKPQPNTTPVEKLLQNNRSSLLERSDLDTRHSSFGSKKDSILNMDVHADGDFVMFKFPGPVGPPGPAGAPGVQGAPGAPGMPGLPGVCPVSCPVMHYYHDTEIFPEGIEPALGSEQRPAPAACRFMPATQQDGPVPDPYWVLEGEKFPVKCDKATNRTCLILNHDDKKWINETKVLMKFQMRTWLSQSGFNLDRFNSVTQKQVRWLQDQSATVRQRIRVYVANSTFPRTNLRMLSAQDVVVGTAPSLTSPMFYSVQKSNNDLITVDGEEWTLVDLTIVDSAKRLPVVDFHVEDASGTQGPAYISLQLRELCFG